MQTSLGALADTPFQITMLYFAGARTSLPGEPYSEAVSIPDSPSPFLLSSLRKLLVELHPDNDEFADVLRKCAWSVNEEMVDRESEGAVVLKGGETVCVIPPVSGG